MYYLAITVVLFSVELIYIRYAGPYILDLPNHRSSHVRPTVRGGGVIFYAGVLAFFISSEMVYPFFFAGLTVIALISFVDDVKGLHQVVRLGAHLIALLLMVTELSSVDFPIWGLALILIVAAGIVNAYNFMDGINGITASYSLITLSTFWYVNAFVVRFVDSDLLVYTSLAVLVFSFFNFRKRALCFAGDVGAVCIAFIIVFLLGKLIIATGDLTYILLLGVYGVDTVGTILERLVKHENIFDAHRSHLYQLLVNESHWPHVLVSLLYGLVQLLINFALVHVVMKLEIPLYGALSILGFLVGIFALTKIKFFRVFQ